MGGIDRRAVVKGMACSAPAMTIGGVASAAGASPAAPDIPREQTGFGVWPAEGSNPLDARVTCLTVVTPDIDASVRFYRDVMGYPLADEGVVVPRSTAPGAGALERRYALMHEAAAERPGTVRLLSAPDAARANRPRPEARVWDPGLLIMECGTADPAESYHRLKSAGTPTISPPRYYPFRGAGPELDPMSYAPFGPAGEQMFITAGISNSRPEWREPGLHKVPTSVAIVSLDQRPVDDFYFRAFGLRRTSQLVSQQRNCNELIGAPRDATFLWGVLGGWVTVEVWEFRMPKGTVYPTSLDRTGLAMFTLRVNDLDRCRAMCRVAGIPIAGEGALPLVGTPAPRGFTLRGAVGELIEVVG